jgi:hypothetical protein
MSGEFSIVRKEIIVGLIACSQQNTKINPDNKKNEKLIC